MTIESLVSHAESTSSTLMYALLSLLTPPGTNESLFHAASHLGTSQMLVTLLRGLPYHASHNRMIIPAEITARHEVAHEDVFRRGGEAKGVRDAVWEFASVANEQLGRARSGSEGKVPREAMPVFLAGVGVNPSPDLDY